jgi:hypothetical protein
MTSLRSVSGFAVGALLFGTSSIAQALPGDLLRGVELGASQASATQAVSTKSQQLKVLSATVAQEYSQALLRSDFLAALNRAKAKHSLLENPAERKVSFVSGEDASQKVTLGFAGEKLEAVFVRATVRPDTSVAGADNRFSRQRLGPIQKYLSGLRNAGCSLDAEKGARNAFVYRGSCAGSAVYVEYRPEADEFWTVYSSK